VEDTGTIGKSVYCRSTIISVYIKSCFLLICMF